MHVGRSLGNVPQGGGLERASIFLAVGIDKPEFCALLGFGVAVFAETVEFVVQDIIDGLCSSRVGSIGQADVVESAVGEEWPQVAVGAFRPADEQPEPGDSLAADQGVRPGQIFRVHGLDVSVKGGRLRQDMANKGGNGLAEIRIDEVHLVPVGWLHGLPGSKGGRIADAWARMRRAMCVTDRWQFVEDGFILFAIPVENAVGAHGAGEPVLLSVFDRHNRLGPEGVPSAIPEEPGIVCDAYQRHGSPGVDPYPLGKRQQVRESGCRLVAGGAGNLSVGAEARVEEKQFAECPGSGIIGMGVGGILGQGGE